MMSKMRENMPLIMWILVGAFLATIVFSWGMGGFETGGALDGVVGRVGSREIIFDQYNRMVQDRLAQMRNNDETLQIDDATVRRVRNEVWDELVRNELMKAYQGKWGIVTADEEVAFAVRNNPPNWIRENENFLKDGQFDPAAYEEFLRDPRSAQVLVAIEADYRMSMGNQKVIDRIIAPVFVSPQEAWDEFVATNRKFKAAAVAFPLRDFPVDSGAVTAKEIQDYYAQNRGDFSREERRKVISISVPVTATAQDTARVLELAQEAVTRARAGEDFATLVDEYSEDEGTAQRGGDLGYFTSGRMVKEFDSTAFATPPGELAGPVATRFGVHVIKVVDRKPGAEGDSLRASHILLRWKVGPETEERAAQKAKDFTDAAKSEGFAKAAEQFSLEVAETDWFSKNPTGNIPGFGPHRPAMDFLFTSNRGATSYVYRTTVRGSDAYSVFQVKEVSPAGSTPLAEVESRIRGILVRKKQEALALERAQQFRSRVNTAAEFTAAAAAESLKVDTTGEHAKRDFLRVFGADEQIAKTLLQMDPGEVTAALHNARGAYVAVLLSKTTADSAAFNAQQTEILDRLRRNKQNSVYADWYAQAQKDVKVEDKRYLYYTDY